MRFLVAVTIVLVAVAPVLADPSPTPVPSSSATPAARSAWSNTLEGFASMTDQASSGSGIQPPEAAGFAVGNPLSPMTPYDTFASTPNTPGVAGLAQFVLTTRYLGKHVGATLETGLGYATGSTTNNAYWNEPLLPTLDPHLGSQALPYAIAFPTHAGQDDGSNTRGSILAGSVAADDGSWAVRGGWLNLEQSDRFIFAQPPLTNWTPQIGLQPAESLGNGPLTFAGWPSPEPGSPLQGVDVTLHEKSTTLEVTNAALPSLPETSARLTLGSIVLDRGKGTRFSADLLHLTTSGNFLNTTTLFGEDATLNAGPQGYLPTSVLGGQQQTVAGVSASFNVGSTFEALVEVARAWYDAQHVLEPGTAQPGGYYHIALSHATGHATTAIEAFRFEPRYASAYLPYGAPENIWSVAWSWPGVWLKSTYQLVDNSQVGSNRQGYRLHYDLNGTRFQARAVYASYQQIEQATTDNANQQGFVEGFFLPQNPGDGTLGRTHQYGAWLAWHPSGVDLTVDYIDDTMHRDFVASQGQDAVTLNTPQIVITASRMVTHSALVSIGYGRFAQKGSWAHGSLTNVDFGQNVTFAGAQLAESPRALVLVQLRDTALSGLPSIPGGPSPNYHGTILFVEQRFKT